MTNAIELDRLTKSYGRMKAVDEVTFTMEPGKIYGLLGRNGAGKTTLMHMVSAQLFPTDGSLKVFGESPYENNRVLSQMCFIKESQKYPDGFRVSDVLTIAGLFFPNWDREYAYSLLDDFRLPQKQLIKKLSRGMLSSMGIVVGLACRAPLTMFDEPYLGLDAVARDLFYNRLIDDYAAHPRTIVLSTHLIDEVSQILEHVMVIDSGRLILDEDADTLKGRAFNVVGMDVKLDSYLSGKEVVDRQSIGGLVSATVMGRLDARERRHAESLGLELSPVSLQQLIVYLTRGKSDRKVAGGR